MSETTHDSGSATLRSWRTTLAIVAVVALALAIVQSIGWRLDPPRDLPNHIYPRDLWAEGPFKAHEARRWALFGTWSTNDVDNYRFWLVQSPAHVWPLALWLKTLGVTWSNLRLYSVLTYAAGWLVLLATALRLRRDGAAIAVTVAMLGDFYLRWAARSALIEVPLTSLSCVVFGVAVLALRRPGWVFALPVLSLMAILTKQSGAYLGVFSIAAAALVWHRHKADPGARKVAVAWLGFGAAVAAGFLAYALSDDYWRTIEWNANHMMGADNDRAASLSVHYLDPTRVILRIFNGYRWRDVFWLNLPTALPLAAGFLGWLGLRAWNKEPIDDDDTLVAILLLLTVGMLQMTHQKLLRFALVLFPWMWWASGRTLWELTRRYRKAGLAALGITVLTFAATHGRWHVEHAGDPSTAIFDGNDKIASLLDEDDVLVGKTAPWMAFTSRAEHYIMRWPFNCTEEAVRALHPTHILRRGSHEYIRQCLQKVRPDWLRGAETLTIVPFKGTNLYLQSWPLEVEDDTDDDYEAEQADAVDDTGDASPDPDEGL